MKIIISALLLVLLAVVPARAQCPSFPLRGVQIIDALFNPVLANGDDDQRRRLTRTILEQLVFESPADGWTWKSADANRPPSKDSLSRLVFGGRLCNWDWQDGVTRRRHVNAGDLGDDITGQNPIPIAGVNHLTETPGPPTPPVTVPTPTPEPSPVPPPSLDLSGVYSRLETLAGQLQAHDVRLQQHDNEPSWIGRLVRNPAFYSIFAGILAGRYILPSEPSPAP